MLTNIDILSIASLRDDALGNKYCNQDQTWVKLSSIMSEKCDALQKILLNSPIFYFYLKITVLRISLQQ